LQQRSNRVSNIRKNNPRTRTNSIGRKKLLSRGGKGDVVDLPTLLDKGKKNSGGGHRGSDRRSENPRFFLVYRTGKGSPSKVEEKNVDKVALLFRGQGGIVGRKIAPTESLYRKGL